MNSDNRINSFRTSPPEAEMHTTRRGSRGSQKHRSRRDCWSPSGPSGPSGFSRPSGPKRPTGRMTPPRRSRTPRMRHLRHSHFSFWRSCSHERSPCLVLSILPFPFSLPISYVVPAPPPGAGGGVRGGGGPGGSLDSKPAYVPLRDALQEQLGVELKTGKVREEYLIIDHAENPTEN